VEWLQLLTAISKAAGRGNIDADPHLTPDGYHLTLYSPCIDAGERCYIAGPNETDIDGEDRIMDGDCDYFFNIDMGADEFRTCYLEPNYLVVDDFERYTDPIRHGGWTDSNITDVWKDGSENSTGSYITISTDPRIGGPIHSHKGAKAMAYFYDNNSTPFYSEAYADTNGLNSLGIGTDWTLKDVNLLSLWFKGFPDLDGSFTDNNDGTYMIEADGWDIWDTSDGLHYGYKMVNILGDLPVSITARVFSVENTHEWAKAGVMFRSYLDPDSQNVAIVLTPGRGVSFQHRDSMGDETIDEETIDGNVAPHWVRLTFDASFHFIAEHAEDNDGTPGTWLQIGEDLAGLYLPADLYIGLCVTSHNECELCTAEFSDVNMTGTISGEWESQDIGIISNDPESMYVVLQDGDSNAIMYYPDPNNPDNADPNATQHCPWTEWEIDLNDFSDVNLADVQRIYLGIGTKDNPTPGGGSGLVYIDDIRLYPSRCLDRPAGDFTCDCVVDYRDLKIMTDVWLYTGCLRADLYEDVNDIINFKDFAVLADNWLEEGI